MRTNLQVLLQKEVSSGEFLMIVWLAVLSVFGMGTVLKLLAGVSFTTNYISEGLF